MLRTARFLTPVLLAIAPLAAAPKANPAHGKEVFAACEPCHSTALTDDGKTGPTLRKLFKRPKMRSGQPPNEANVRAIIEAGAKGMPSFSSLSAKDKNDLIAYLRTL